MPGKEFFMEATTIQRKIKTLAKHAPHAGAALQVWKDVGGSSEIAKKSKTLFMVVMESNHYPIKIFDFSTSYSAATTIFYHVRKTILNSGNYADINIQKDVDEECMFEAKFGLDVNPATFAIKIVDIPYYMEGLENGKSNPYKREYY